MTRRLRERPRLAVAQLTLAVLGLATALLVGSALAGDNGDRESRLERQLAQASDRQRHLGNRLGRTQAELDRAGARLDRTETELDQLKQQQAARKSTARRRASAGRALRRKLAAAKRALRRARAP